MKNFVVLLLFIILLCSCGTRYTKAGFMGGYDDQQYNDNTFLVTFRGNGFTSLKTAVNCALLRCSELTEENGCKYFEITSDDSVVNTSYYTTDATYESETKYTYSGSKTKTKYNPGQSYSVEKPFISYIIKIYKNVPKTNNPIFSVEDIDKYIRPNIPW